MSKLVDCATVPDQDGLSPVSLSVADSLTVLHLGCGRTKRTAEDLGLTFADAHGTPYAGEVRILNLDGNPDVAPDLLCRLGLDPIPLPDDSVDLIVAMHVIEHIGQTGQTEGWFQFWEEAYRVLRPNGRLSFECPYHSSVWAWADPTHVRAISEYTFLYFNQDAYRCGGAIPDYRIRCDFQNGGMVVRKDTTNEEVAAKEAVSFINGTLIARKPLKPWWEDGQ